MKHPLIISFYTKDWLYLQHAQRLQKECKALGLNHLIVEKPSRNSYLKNTCIKPEFILECFELKRPLLWIDVDASIYKKPDFFLEDGFDFQAKKITNPQRTRVWHVGTMYFNPSAKMEEFMKDWIAALRVTDEQALEQTWRSWKDKIISRDIPQAYFEIEPSKPSKDCVIYHRLSKGSSKDREYQIALNDEIENG